MKKDLIHKLKIDFKFCKASMALINHQIPSTPPMFALDRLGSHLRMPSLNWPFPLKILNQGQPVYLRELIHPYTSSRNTRRSSPKLKFLQTPNFDRRVHKSIKHFSNSFCHYAPVLWNSFPFHVRNSPSVPSFRKHLKTHLFSSSFPT